MLSQLPCLERGHLVVAGSVNDIVQQLEGQIVLDMRLTANSDGGARALQVLNGYPDVKEARTEGGHVTIDFTGTHDDVPPLLAHLVSQGVPAASFSQR
jgi:hypothetical protein